MKKRAMIMAAGIGSRLEPLTSCKPKPMVPVANLPIMQHILLLLKKYGFTDVIYNTHYQSDSITGYFTANSLKNMHLEYIHEDKLSGTAGGVKKCEEFLNQGETFVVMSGDSLTDVNLEKLIKRHKESGATASMGLKAIPKEEVIHMGVVVTDEKGKILEFQEKPPIEEAKSNMVNTGIYIFEPELFDYIPADTFYDFAKQVFPALMKDNKPLYGFEIDEYWNDIGTLNQYRLSSYDVINEKINIDIPGKKFEHGWIGFNNKIDQSVSYIGSVIIGNNNMIDSNIAIKNRVTIGSNCNISKDSTLDGCMIWDNVKIGENCNLHECIIGNNVAIGNNVTINKGAIIADNSIVEDGKEIPAETKIKMNEIFA